MSGVRLSTADRFEAQNANRCGGLAQGKLAFAPTLLVVALLLSGCSTKPTAPSVAFPGMDAFSGWVSDGQVEVFDRDTLYHLVDGQADVFLAYGFEQVAVRRYENAEGVQVDVHTWKLATPQDAYGLFTADVNGTPVDIGNSGDLKPQRSLCFWQDRYTVWVHARPGLDDAELLRFASVISEALPKGGERPAQMDQLPARGLVERSALFFHQEISIQDRLWLGGENLLGLSPKTDGILAQYEIGGVTAHLLLIQYPSATAAAAGLAALLGSQVEGLVVAEVHEDLLGAVFGETDKAAASSLLVEALVAGNRVGNAGRSEKTETRPCVTNSGRMSRKGASNGGRQTRGTNDREWPDRYECLSIRHLETALYQAGSGSRSVGRM